MADRSLFRRVADSTIIKVSAGILVLGVLIGIGGISYMNHQTRAEQTAIRESRAKVISAALEDYYSRHGKYPGTGMITQGNADKVADILGVDKENLLDPKAPRTIENSIVSFDEYADTTNTVFRYLGFGSNLSACRTTTPVGSCEAFLLSYKDTTTNAWKEVRSHHGQRFLP